MSNNKIPVSAQVTPSKKSDTYSKKNSQGESANVAATNSLSSNRDKEKTLPELATQQFDHQTFLKNLTSRPGIYQMHDSAGEVIYIGKAKNLKNRVGSYFASRGLTAKTVALVARIARIDVTVTATEAEALILEQNLIKTHRPPFNILLRDDKSYPYVFLSEGDYPRLSYHRGAKRYKGRYFGPYPNAAAVRESLHILQRMFKVRQCEDSFYRARSRPCLQYQIKRCTAPCVQEVSSEDYQLQVDNTRLFLEGKSSILTERLAEQMQQAANELAFEEAGEYRDQIQYLQKITEAQFIESDASGQSNANTDVVAVSVKAGACCVHVLYIRAGRMLGSKSFYPKLTLDQAEAEMLDAFLMQYYLEQASSTPAELPERLIVSFLTPEAKILEQAITRLSNKKIAIVQAKQGLPLNWIQLARDTAEENLKQRLADKESMRARFFDLQQQFQLDEMPNRIECFDISHSSGEDTVASCVVFDQAGPIKSDYRRFNIEGITGGDDYAAMRQALHRRFKRLVSGEGKCPDILLIDGGKGQVSQAKVVLAEFQLSHVLIIGVAKGSTRKAGLEKLILANENKVVKLNDDAKALHLIQHVRDESHRFAVKGHTARRDKKRSKSQLDDIPGVGPKRRKDLLLHFGSVKAVKESPVRELIKVQGVSEKIAEDIYACFHND